VNRLSTQLLHGLNRSSSIPELDRLTLRDGSASGGGGGVAKVSEIGEDGGEGLV
jgi:hypothetical protein